MFILRANVLFSLGICHNIIQVLFPNLYLQQVGKLILHWFIFCHFVDEVLHLFPSIQDQVQVRAFYEGPIINVK